MLWAIDNPTVLVINGTSHLLLGLTCWLTLRAYNRGRTLLWSLAGVIAGLGIALIGLRHVLPDWLGREVAVALMVGAPMLGAQALRLELERPWRTRTLLLGLFFFVLVFHLLRQHAPVPWRISWILLNLFFWITHMSWAAWQIAERWHSRSARGMAFLYAGFVLTIAIALGSHGESAPQTPLWEPSDGDKMFHILSYLLEMVGALGYIGMVLERMTFSGIRQATETGRVHEIRKRSHELKELDRQRNIAMLSASLAEDLRPHLNAIAVHCRKPLQQPDEASMLQHFNSIIAEADQASSRIERLRQFLRPPSETRNTIDMRTTTDAVVSLLLRELQEQHIRVRWLACDSDTRIRTQQLDLSQAILNLIRHAVDDMRDQPQRQLTLSCQKTGAHVRLELHWTSGTGRNSPAQAPGPSRPSHGWTEQELGLLVTRNIAERLEGRLSLGVDDRQQPCAMLELPVATGDAP